MRRDAGLSAGTPLEVHREAERRAQELAATTVYIGDQVLPASDPEAAGVFRDSYLSSFPQDDSGEPIGVPEVEGRALAILSSGGSLSRPAPTIEDARNLYIRERVDGDINETAKAARLNRALKHLSDAGVGKGRALTSLTREDARNVRDYLVRDLNMKAETVRRCLNDVRALINLGMTEFGLRDTMANPFQNLPIRGQTHQRQRWSETNAARCRRHCFPRFGSAFRPTPGKTSGAYGGLSRGQVAASGS